MLIAPRNTLSHTQIKFYSKYLDNVLWSRHLKFIITSMCGGFLIAQIVKTLPEMQEIQVWSLGQEDPLEKGMRTHSSILAWRIPWTEKPGGIQSIGSQSQTRLRNLAYMHTRHTHVCIISNHISTIAGNLACLKSGHMDNQYPFCPQAICKPHSSFWYSLSHHS